MKKQSIFGLMIFSKGDKMKTARIITILIFTLCLTANLTKVSEAAEMGTAFTYQGHLYDSNHVANSLYDFQFKLYDDPNVGFGKQLGSTVNKSEIDVIDSYFTVELDFGGSVFDGNAVWLEIGIRPGEQNDPKIYTILNPRQALTPVPYALYAVNGNEGATYTGQAPINVDNSSNTIGLNPATNAGDLMTWDGMNWIAKKPDILQYDRSNMQPFLTVNFVIALQGIFPSRNAAEPFIGEIMMVGFNFAPRGWALCDGQLLAINQNTALFSLLGTTYGGDGRTTFGLPDLRGRVPLHQGQGYGLSPRSMGAKSGSETITDTRLEN